MTTPPAFPTAPTIPARRTLRRPGTPASLAFGTLCALALALCAQAVHATGAALPLDAGDRSLWLACLVGAGLLLLNLGLGGLLIAQRHAIAGLAAALARQAPGEAALPETGPAPVARLAAVLNAARQRDDERAAEHLDVQAAFAHDLRTPLTRLGLRCELLADAPLRAAMERDLREMESLVDASIASARTQRGIAETPRRIDADAFLQSLVGDYRDAGHAVALDGFVGRTVTACPQGLRRVLANLIDNALRHGDGVGLRVRTDDRHLVLAVVDCGPGIAPADLERVFTPWYRAPNGGRRSSGSGSGSGSGLGLAIARRLALAMRGELQLKNRCGGGLEARLSLPLAAA